MIDSAHLFDEISRLYFLLAEKYNRAISDKAVLPQNGDFFARSSPFSLLSMISSCLEDRSSDVQTMEQKHWDLVNYYPSYLSYSCVGSCYDLS